MKMVLPTPASHTFVTFFFVKVGPRWKVKVLRIVSEMKPFIWSLVFLDTFSQKKNAIDFCYQTEVTKLYNSKSTQLLWFAFQWRSNVTWLSKNSKLNFESQHQSMLVYCYDWSTTLSNISSCRNLYYGNNWPLLVNIG